MMLVLLVACGQPEHLQYDYGRAYSRAFDTQADITRTTVKDSVYPLTGAEAEAMRKRVTEETTEKKSGKVEAVQ